VGRSGRQQPPGRALAAGEDEQQPAAPGDDVGDAGRKVHVELGVGEHDLLAVRLAVPADARIGPHPAVRAIAPGDETVDRLLDAGRRA
jgi:hypothetical protein